jgi:hypothetical protein
LLDLREDRGVATMARILEAVQGKLSAGAARPAL